MERAYGEEKCLKRKATVARIARLPGLPLVRRVRCVVGLLFTAGSWQTMGHSIRGTFAVAPRCPGAWMHVAGDCSSEVQIVAVEALRSSRIEEEDVSRQVCWSNG